MPVNRYAVLRYKIIDKCLRDTSQKWTLAMIIESCSKEINNYTNSDKGVSYRTVQNDIQNMRSNKYGYNAPIIVIDNKYYEYSNPNYSFLDHKFVERDFKQMIQTINTLKQFTGFSKYKKIESLLRDFEEYIFLKNRE